MMMRGIFRFLNRSQITARPEMTSACVPDDGVPPWLNHDFLQTILRRDAGDASLSVVHVNVCRAVAKGENSWSTLLRVRVEFSAANCGGQNTVCSLLVKSRPRGQLLEKWLAAVGHFRRESQMYNVTLPAMYKSFNEETGSDDGRITPRVYVNERPDTIVMQDLQPLGYKMFDRRRGLDLRHGKVALRTLARLHGLSVALHVRDPAQVEDYGESLYTEDTRVLRDEFMVPFYLKLAGVVASWPGFERFEEKIEHVSQVELDRMMEMVRDGEGSIRVLNHGDFWTNNILFRYEGDEIVDAKVIDFQVVRFASPALDIIYFLHTSLRQQVLEDHTDELLDCYHEALDDVMRRLHCPPDRLVSRQQLAEEMADKQFYGVIVSCMLCFMIAEPKDATEFSSLRDDAVQKGVDDMSRMFQGRIFRDAFQKRLLKFEAQGII